MFWGVNLTAGGEVRSRPLLASNLPPVCDTPEPKKNSRTSMYEQTSLRSLLELRPAPGAFRLLDFVVEAPLGSVLRMEMYAGATTIACSSSIFKLSRPWLRCRANAALLRGQLIMLAWPGHRGIPGP